MFKIMVIAVTVVSAGILADAATKPDTFSVLRSARIKAAPGKIFPLINDLNSWSAWSPYEKKDSAMKRTFSGASSGKGAIYAWEGNRDIGEGSMEITDALAPSRLTIQLNFVKPFEAHNVVEFMLQPEGDVTQVTWAMRGANSYVSKLMGVFFDMDKMVGKEFEAGLASLKAIAER